MKRFFLTSAVLLFAFFPSAGLARSFPAPSGFVNDFSGTLSSEEKTAFETKLQTFERESKNEIAIAIFPDLGGETIEQLAVELFTAWGIGKKNADNGVLIVLAMEDRAMRVAVGYGLEETLTDAQSFWIIQNIMRPAFQVGNFPAGLDGAVDKIIAATKGEVIPSAEAERGGLDFGTGLSNILMFGFFIAIWFSSILGRSKSWWAGGVVGGVAGIIVGFIFGFLYIGILSMVFLVPLGLLFDFVVSRAYAKGKATGHIPWWVGGRGFGGRGP